MANHIHDRVVCKNNRERKGQVRESIGIVSRRRPRANRIISNYSQVEKKISKKEYRGKRNN